MMNFKTKLVGLLIISVFLLSSCEVYKTLYGAPPKETPKETATKVIRLEGDAAKDPANLAKEVYATAAPTAHDPFKVGPNPLGPFDKGKSLGFTLQQWLSASGIGIYSVDDGNAEMELSFKNLVPNGVYTVWCSRLTFPPEPNIVDKPCGAENGSQNSFTADSRGIGSFSLKLKALEASTKETASMIALAYHSDSKTYGASPGDFGSNTHVQIFFLMPAPAGNATKYEVPIKFTNHIDASLPEQDVFIEKEAEKMPEEAIKAEEKPKEEMKKEEKPVTGEAIKEEKPEEKVTEQKPEGKPVVITVQETELVSLSPQAEDPDKNTNLVFTFTSPLSENGEWQTTYGDAGEYTVTVTASDGELTTSKDVLVIVNKKEEAPTIDSAKPIESGLAIDENQAIDFSVAASDLNKDTLTYAWKLDGDDVGTDSKYTYQTDYDSAGTHTVKVDVSDGVSSASKIWSVDVKNVNRKPVLEKIDNIKAKETDKIVITALATDDDKDSITYFISDKRFTQEDNVFTWQTDYNSAGTYEVTVSASDGQDTAEQAFTVTVENVNRPPVIGDIIQKK
ncbi:hypothetical protein HYX03_01960 [Candidatus Woesearchaeota archaeon]|nr:hypothetical protein [Candidatus Woesearchaeota archaeon]